MELYLLQEMQAIEEKKLQEKIKKAQQDQKDLNKKTGKKNVLVNRAHTVKNSELKGN